MKIAFSDSGIGDACNDPQNGKLDRYIKKTRAPFGVDYILTVLRELESCPNVATLPSYYHYELLKHNLSGYASITLKIPNQGGRKQWRMLVRPVASTGDINDRTSINELIIGELISNHYK